MLKNIESVNANRFWDTRFLNGEFFGGEDSVYHIFFFPQENPGFFKLGGNWADIVQNRIIFISPGAEFSVKCEEASLDCFHVTFKSRSAYTGSPGYYTVVPPERRFSFTGLNIDLVAACLAEKRAEAHKHLCSILEMMDAMISDSRITYAIRHGGRLLRDIPRHFHKSEYQIEYFVEGNGTVYTGNRWVEFSQGSFCFIPPGIVHEIIYPRSGNLDNYSIKFKLSGDSHLPTPADAFVNEVSPELKPVVLGLLKKIVGEYVQDIPSSSEKLYSLIKIINKIRDVHSEKAGKNSLVDRIKQIINANNLRKMRIMEIACQMNLSHEYVSRLFRKHTGQTLASYINSQRLESSLVMVKNTNMPFKQIAAECGFKNVNYFHTTFKKYFSLTPRYIRKYRDKEIQYKHHTNTKEEQNDKKLERRIT